MNISIVEFAAFLRAENYMIFVSFGVKMCIYTEYPQKL